MSFYNLYSPQMVAEQQRKMTTKYTYDTK